jgi:hypothetical protein
MYFLHKEAITHINQKQVTVLAQASMARDPITSTEVWKRNGELDLTRLLSSNWDSYIAELNRAGVTLHINAEDSLLWTGGNSYGNLTVKNYYDAIISTQELLVWCDCQGNFWKWKLQLKVIFFFGWMCTKRY